MNNIELIGVVKSIEFSRTINGEKYYCIMLNVKRTSGVYDTLPLFIPMRNIKIDEDIVGKLMSVNGEIRTKNIEGHLKVYILVRNMCELIIDENPEDFIGENLVEISGNICINNHVRNTPLGRKICDFCLAINHDDSSSYIPCIAWGKNADYADLLRIGDEINIIGRLQSRDYIKGGTTFTTYELSIQNFGGFS